MAAAIKPARWEPQTLTAIREAALEDIAALMDIEERSFSADRLSRRSFRHLLTEGNSVTLVDETQIPTSRER